MSLQKTSDFKLVLNLTKIMVLNSSEDAPMRTATENTRNKSDMPPFQQPGDNALMVVADFDHVSGQDDEHHSCQKIPESTL